MAKYTLVILLFFLQATVFAQQAVPLLEREISITVVNQPVGAVLTKISEQGKFTFSYSTKVVDANRMVTVRASGKSVRQVLALVFDDNISYKASGSYVILNKAESAGKKVVVSGYVTDKSSGKKLANTSVYDVNTMTSAISDDYGYYEITVPKKQPKVNLSVKKDSYSDTSITVAPIKNQMVEISIEPAPYVELGIDTAGRSQPLKEAGVKFFTGAKAFINTVNIKDTIERRFQVSLLPYIGTNHLLSANVINHASFNVIGGYSMGNKGAEFGGIFNINRQSVQGFQAGGILNVVGGDFKGFQAGGILNSVHGRFKGFQAGGILNVGQGGFDGFQAAGAFNIAMDTVQGFQAAGFFNFAKGRVSGFQAAGFMNIDSDTTHAVTVAGFANIAVKYQSGVAIAGLFNYSTRHHNGAQIAGLFNCTGSASSTIQIAGLLNFSARKSGAIQLAGLLNYATHINGLQLAPFNFADTCSQGLPIGFASFVRKGTHQIEVAGDELLFTSLSFRTGTPGFHNIFTSGISLNDNQSPLWYIGYGAGTSIILSKRFYLDLELTANHLSKGAFNTSVNLLSKFYIGPEFAITKKVRIAMGPTVNLFVAKATTADYVPTFSSLAPYSFTHGIYNHDLALKLWIGARVAFRFF